MSNLGIDWQTTGANWKYQKQAQFGAYTQNKSTQTQGTTTPVTIQSQTADVLSLSHTSGCTDGVDDGHVGLFSAIGNIGKGVGKTVVNAVKNIAGFNSDGSWSPLKLAKTVAIGAVCTIFPPAALVACGIGAVAGGAQIIKGIGNAMSATTDAEAKSAWQNVGAGTFTTAASVVGAKASYKGVMNGAKANGGSALEDLAGSGSTKISSLIKEKGITETAKALGKDMWSSTKNSWSNVKTLFSDAKNAAEITKLRKKLAKTEGSAKTDAELSMEKNLEVQETFASDRARQMADTATNLKSDIANGLKITKLRSQLAKADKTALTDAEVIAQRRLSSYETLSGDNAIKIADTLTNAGTKIRSFNLANVLKSVKNVKVSELPSNISTQSKSILEALQTSKYNSVVNQYGYENVLEALEVFGALQTLDTAI